MSGRLSLWGWGYADQFPDRAGRELVAQGLRERFGFEGLSVRGEPSLEEIDLPAPRLEVPDALDGRCTSDPEDRILHTYGRAYPDLVRGFQGQYDHPPDVVAHPRSEEEVEELLDWCDHNRVAVIPFGGGTSVVGGVEADVPKGYAGVLSLDVRALDQVLELDTVSGLARIQAGASGPGLESQLAEHGYTLRHFPQSFEFSTLGGWIATRSGGHFATLYTHIDEFVSSVRMLTPAGPIESLSLPASGAGPDPNRLVLGSEGTLGVITEAVVRVSPRPRWRARASAHFGDFTQAVEAVRSVAQAKLYPANCRLLDSAEAVLAGVGGDGGHVLLLAFESAHHPVDGPLRQAVEVCQELGGVLPDPPSFTEAKGGGSSTQSDAAAASWRRAFLEGPYRFNVMVSLGVLVDTFETACTWRQFPDLHQDIQQTLRRALEEVCGQGRLTCRFTHVYPDGPAPYYTFLAPAKAGSELEQWREIKAAASETLLKHGAAITHHHAVGRVHKPWYQRQSSEAFLNALRATKRTVDPGGILNPGVLIDPA